MRMNDVLIAQEQWRKEERRKKECEPYEQIIRRLRKLDRENPELDQSPTDRKS